MGKSGLELSKNFSIRISCSPITTCPPICCDLQGFFSPQQRQLSSDNSLHSQQNWCSDQPCHSHRSMYTGKNFNLYSGHCVFKFIDTNIVPKNVTPPSISAGARASIHSSHFNFPELTHAFLFYILCLIVKREIRKEKGVWFP